MSFDKTYPKRKDWRRPYRRAAAFDNSCRPHGGCPWCERGRTLAERRAQARAQADATEFWEDSNHAHGEAHEAA